MPGGSVEVGETVEEAAVREAREEIGVEIAVDDLKFQGITAYHQTEVPDVDVFFFSTWQWSGEPRIVEPHKHRRLSWERIDAYPENLTEHCKVILGHLDRAVYVRVLDGEIERIIT